MQVRYKALIQDNNISMLCFNFKMNLISISSMTKMLKEGRYGALNPETNVALYIWNEFISNFSMTFFLHHADNDVLWLFMQMQNTWRPRKLKQGRYEALKQGTNSSMLCLKIKMNLIIISSMTFHLSVIILTNIN